VLDDRRAIVRVLPRGLAPGGRLLRFDPGGRPCGEQLACVADGDPEMGECAYWCDSNHPCPAGSCTTITDTNGVTLSFCVDFGDLGGQDGGGAPAFFVDAQEETFSGGGETFFGPEASVDASSPDSGDSSTKDGSVDKG
jgi:hypothetical protein